MGFEFEGCEEDFECVEPVLEGGLEGDDLRGERFGQGVGGLAMPVPFWALGSDNGEDVGDERL